MSDDKKPLTGWDKAVGKEHMRRGPKNYVEQSFVSNGATMHWENEPLDGEEVYATPDPTLYDSGDVWNIYLASTGGWLGYAIKPRFRPQQQMA